MMARRHPVSPNQLALWRWYDLHGQLRPRAINGPLGAVNDGQRRAPRTTGKPRSGGMTNRPRRSSKLVMRVRFPSPAPLLPRRSATCEPSLLDISVLHFGRRARRAPDSCQITRRARGVRVA